ncbi:MAG: cyclic nucleotide-binding domain-containing protein [Pseudomonadota bacterium]|nr:cyclic nucleotide-binding domain-containing protein [Pseudomonadota bacterium]
MSSKADVEQLCNSSIGNELTVTEGRVLSNVMGARVLKEGELLSSEGGVASTLYILIDGKLDVISDNEGEQEVVYTMSRGECAGTRAFVDRSPRKATLRANGDATIYTLEPDAFESLLDEHPQIIYKVMRALFRNTHTNLMRMNQESQQLANYISKSGGRY